MLTSATSLLGKRQLLVATLTPHWIAAHLDQASGCSVNAYESSPTHGMLEQKLVNALEEVWASFAPTLVATILMVLNSTMKLKISGEHCAPFVKSEHVRRGRLPLYPATAEASSAKRRTVLGAWLRLAQTCRPLFGQAVVFQFFNWTCRREIID